jgi:parvulin-like peptidyl-prolyl isomerase
MADGKTAADYYKDLALQQYKKVMISVLKAKESKPPLTVPQEIKDKYDASFTKLINDNFSGKRIDADKAAVAELGVNIDEFKQLLYDQYLSQQFDDKYFNDAIARLLPDVTEADAQAKYNETPTDYNTYTVAHILILTVDPTTGTALSDTAIQDAYTRATELQTKINNGESLADLAAQYSEDSGTKDIGGIFSFNKLSTKIDPYIISWAQSAETGVLSIQQSNAGFHVIRLDKSEATPFASIVEDIRNEIAAKKADDEMVAWTTDPKYDLSINATALSKISVIR